MPVYTEKDWELITILKDGHMSEQPAIAALMKIAIASGDFSKLRAFLDAHPILLATAQANIRKAEWQREANPFMPPPPRWKWQEMLNGPIRLGYLDEARSMTLGLAISALDKHGVVVGGTGQGKTVLVYNLLINTHVHNEGISQSKRFNTIVFDLGKKEYRGILQKCNNFKVISVEKVLLSILKLHPFWGPQTTC